MSANQRSIPTHLSENVFKEYENIIGDICRYFPEQITIPTTTVAPTTFAARLRDAISSGIQYRWPHTNPHINYDKLSRIRKDFAVRIQGTSVWIGPRRFAGKIDAQASFSIRNVQAHEALRVMNWDTESVDIICSLVGSSKLPPVSFPAEANLAIEEARKKYDIEPVRSEDRIVVL